MEYFDTIETTNTMRTPEQQETTFETTLIFTRKDSQKRYASIVLNITDDSERFYETVTETHANNTAETTATTGTTTANTTRTNSDEEEEVVFEKGAHFRCPSTTATEEATKKRDKKKEDKEDRKVCRACRLIVSKTKRRTGMCHNCHKVYEAAEEIAIKNGGEITYEENVKGFRVSCQGGWHTWTTPFQVKIVKYWCEKCTRTERDTRKAYHRAAEAQRQRELFEQ